jgi:curli biogenesis system outer membrane secretion channel CsgG
MFLGFSGSCISEEINAKQQVKAEEGLVEQKLTLKKKVAIARFTNETQSGATFLVDDSGDRIGKQASDILSARLTETGFFVMFERIDSGKTSAEQVMAGLEESGVGVDYLILGSVSEFGRSRESKTGVFARAQAQKAYAKVNVRLIDVQTGRIIHSSEGAGEATTETKKTLGVGTSAGFDQALTDKAISSAISQVIGNLVTSMTKSPWKSYFLDKEEDLYIMSGGISQGLSEGVELLVYKTGRTIKNKQTGAMITLPGRKVGAVRVVSTYGDDEFSEVSFLEFISGGIDQDLGDYYLTNE